MNECFYCKATDQELRPYGPNGERICHPCATSPEHEAETEAVFAALVNEAILDAARGDGVIIIGGEDGIQGR